MIYVFGRIGSNVERGEAWAADLRISADQGRRAIYYKWDGGSFVMECNRDSSREIEASIRERATGRYFDWDEVYRDFPVTPAIEPEEGER